MNKRKSAVLSLLVFTVVVLLHVLHIYHVATLPATLLTGTRWLFLATLGLYGIYKRSLTTWIMISMAVGIELGFDFPEWSQQLRVLSQIFLKLIKTIIAPLLFGTLVVGIAGHSSLKQVGRMGWKTLLYF